MATDPRVFNSPTFDYKVPAAQGPAPSAPSNYKAPELVGQGQVLEGSRSIAEAKVTLDQNMRTPSTVAQSAAAAWDESTIPSADRYFGTPKFAKDFSYTAGGSLQAVAFPLTQGDREYLMKSESQEEFNHRLDSIERYNKNTQTMADHGVVSMAVGALDPAYIALDIASGGVGALAQAARVGRIGQRVAVGVTAGAGAVGLEAMQDRPVSATEMVMSGLLNGAAGATFYHTATRSMRAADPEFPAGPLREVSEVGLGRAVRTTDEGVAEAVQAEVRAGAKAEGIPQYSAKYTAQDPMPEFVPGTETSAKKVLQDMQASPDMEMAGFSKRMHELLDTDIGMQTAKVERSGYDLRRNSISLREGAGQWEQLHEIAHGMTANRLRFGRRNPESTIGKISKQLDELQQEVQAAAKKNKDLTPAQRYYTSSTDELMAGLFSGDKGFTEFMRQLPGSKNTPVLRRAVDAVRNILGIPRAESSALQRAMGLTDDMMQQPLHYRSAVKEMDGADSFYTSGILHSPPQDPSKLAAAIIKNEDKLGAKIGRKVSWSLHKTLSDFSPQMREIATKLVDDPLDMTGDSVVSQARAIRADLLPLQIKYEDRLKEIMAEQGAGIVQRVFSPQKSLRTQAAIEKEVAMEMLARERSTATGLPHPANPDKTITELADRLDNVADAALKEMQAAGVKGSEVVHATQGYFSRKWNIESIEQIERSLMDGGLSEVAAKGRVRDALAQGMRRANAEWDDELSRDIAGSIIDRARRKGYFEDSAYSANAGAGDIGEIRDILASSGIDGSRLQRAMDVLNKVTDEEGKASFLKARIDIDMRSTIAMPDGSTKTIADLIDTNLSNITDRYLDNVAGRAALARKGLEDASAVVALRREALHSIEDGGRRAEAAKLFDDVIKSITGQPTGDDMPAFMRASSAATRMVGLASSGLWQATEYAPMMAKYGALKTMKHMLKEMPIARQLFGEVSKDPLAATTLKDILTRNASADLRLRPFVQRLEDNFEMPKSAHVQLALQQMQQLVPYLNAQKMVQTHQSRVMANVLVDTLEKAAKGDTKARGIFEQYGLKQDIMDRLGDQINKHGMDTAKWSDGVWMDVRGPIGKAVDEAVLRARTGEIPAFAQFNSAGKFIFTFRSFVLGAHNKVLAGTLSRDGIAGLSLALLYQFPLAMMANLANAGMAGKPVPDEKTLIQQSLGQMGSFGLFSELFGIVSGEKQQFGAPGLIFIDRLYKTTGKAAAGEWGQAASSALSATPIIGIIPGVRAIGTALKE